jgi:predicted molibdopterin-dependent oxidoreductase YjgC
MAMTQRDRRIRQHPELGPIGDVVELAFTCDGEMISGIEGDTVASALLAAGRRVFRTMPKTGEARGGFCLVGRCVDCLMIVDGVPSVRACRTPIAAGMTVRTQYGLGDWNGEAAS